MEQKAKKHNAPPLGCGVSCGEKHKKKMAPKKMGGNMKRGVGNGGGHVMKGKKGYEGVKGHDQGTATNRKNGFTT